MKKFNLKLLTPLLVSLVLQGCMPDSLTKFKKDPAKKVTVAASTHTPVTDASGKVVDFVEPTTMTYYQGSSTVSVLSLAVLTERYEYKLFIDNTLGGDPTIAAKFIDSCALDTTGDVQTRDLGGLAVDPTNCKLTGVPTAIKTVQTPFCSDPTKLTQTTCEASYQTWNAVTSKCSNPDYQYKTQATCVAAKNKWYAVGTQVPYRVVLKYRNFDGTLESISTTIQIGYYTKLTTLNYTQSDKVLLKVTPNSGILTDIAPIVTTPSSPSYLRENMIVSSDQTYGVARYVDTSLSKIGISKLVPIYLTDVSSFSENGFISVLGTGVCSDVTKTTKATCIAAAGTWTMNKLGRVFKKDPTYNVLYVENISLNNLSFAINDKICPASNCDSTSPLPPSIIDVDNETLFSAQVPYIDNDSQFYSNKYLIGSATSIFETTYNIKPMAPVARNELVPANAITYSISPALPPSLSFNASTGVISGNFAVPLDATTFTIKATNALGSVSTDISLGAIKAPADLGLTTKQIITVSNTANFKEGEDIFQQIVPPLTTAPTGRILKILNSYQMAIEASNGAFLQNASLDSGSQYFGEKAYVIPDNSCVNTNYTTQATCIAPYVWSTGPIYYDLALTINSSGNYVAGNYINATAAGTGSASGVGAKGLVAGVFTAANDIIYVKFLTQGATGVSSVKTFYQGNIVDSGPSIVTIDSGNLKLDLSNAAAFNIGSDITTNNGSGAYTNNISGNTLYVSDITKKPAGAKLKNGDLVANDETYSASAITINNVTHDNLLTIERGQYSLIHADLSVGNSITYSITPSLPTGLTLDTKKGTISGTPVVAMPRKDFLLTATNFINSTTYVFSLEVKDYFQLTHSTPAPSFLLHKVGDTQINRKCRINANDILGGANNGKALDVRCFLDGEEEDIHFNSLKIAASSGPSVCEYIQYAPYYFEQFSPIKSKSVSSKYPTVTTIHTGCQTDGTVPTADLCDGNYYDSVKAPTAPNCDEGYLEYDEIVASMSGGAAPTCSVYAAPVRKKVLCNGKRIACISGPIKDVLADSDLQAGSRSVIYSAAAGLSQTWTHTSPFSKIDLTNLRVSNGMVVNKCSSSNTDVNTWATKASAVYSSPFGARTLGGSNPYYVFNCLDAAKEIKARIRLVIRDWDRSFRIDDSIDNQSPSAPSAKMRLGSTLDPSFGTQYNNHYAWDDDYQNYLTGCSDGVSVTKTACLAAGKIWTAGTAASYTGAGCGAQAAPASPACPGVTMILNAPDCANAGGTWTAGACDFDNQYQCTIFGGTWSGDQEFKFPKSNI